MPDVAARIEQGGDVSSRTFLNGRVTLWPGDCIEVMQGFEANSFDACVTDPPYHLVSIGARFGKPNSKPPNSKDNPHQQYNRLSAGFMGKVWDGGDIAFRPETWAEVLRVLKPGAHLLAFGADKNYHRLACAIEDGGFEIRHMILYLYGSGFPKSLNVGKSLDAAQERCACSEDLRSLRDDVETKDAFSGDTQQDVLASLHGTEDFSEANGAIHKTPDRMRPMRQDGHRPAAVASSETATSILQSVVSCQGARGSLEAVCGERAGEETSRQGAERGDEPGLEGRSDLSPSPGELRERPLRSLSSASDFDGADGRLRDGTSVGDGGMDRASALARGVRSSHRSQASQQSVQQSGTLAGQPQPQARRAWEDCDRCGKPIVPDGLGTALKPSVEPIVLARKPLSEPTIAANVLCWGVGAINIDGSRIKATDGYTENAVTPASLGRWPANIILDGSDEVVEAFPEIDGQIGMTRNVGGSLYSPDYPQTFTPGTKDTGSAARFFYTSKADADDRIGSKHPTVKPLDLMQYLCRLVTPRSGTIFDPFAGTGTTGEAAWREGFSAVLIEREAEYVADIERRMGLCLAGPDERARESIKARLKDKPVDHGPLFGEAAA